MEEEDINDVIHEEEEEFVYVGGDTLAPQHVVHAQVHPSVSIIPEGTFSFCDQLKDVKLCEGLLEIGDGAFHGCSALKRIQIPSTTKVLHSMAFTECRKIEVVDLGGVGGALEEIQDSTFDLCNDLKRIVNIPPTIKSIGRFAFRRTNLARIDLPDGIQNIDEYAFCHTQLTNFRLPPLIKTIPKGIFHTCTSMFSLEIPKRIVCIEQLAVQGCSSLRNIALPASCIVEKGTFDWCMPSNRWVDLKRLPNCTNDIGVSSEWKITYALKTRFDNLPIHKMLYYQSYQSVTSDQLSNAITNTRDGGKQDCLGMTPLHILACSTVQNLQLYQVLIGMFPENLVTEDIWGALPILYVVWGNVQSDIVDFLVERYQSLYPGYRMNWTNMAETLIRAANVQEEAIQKLLDVHFAFPIPKQIDWKQVLDKIQLGICPRMFLFLVRCCFTGRANAIGVKQWRNDMLDFLPSAKYNLSNKRNFIVTTQSKLAKLETRYQNLKESITLLELALWKNKISDLCQEVGGGSKRRKIAESDLRAQCRVRCEADFVIEHVLPYLLPTSATPSQKSKRRW